MTKAFVRSAFALVVLLVSSHAFAIPTLITLANFQPGDTLIDFNTVTNNQVLDAAFLAQGVAFTNLWGDTTGQSASIFGSGAAENFTSSCFAVGGCDTVTATFTSPVRRVGFDFITNAGTTSIQVLLAGTIFNIPSTLTPSFVGIEDLDGITEIRITAPVNQAIGMDNFRIGVPEPATTALLGLGLLGMSVIRRRRGTRA
jgi:hypothetical protein